MTRVSTMNDDFQTHVCTVKPLEIPQSKYFKSRVKRKLQDWITIWENNHSSLEFYGHRTEIFNKKLEHIKSGSWLVHPFSKFITYYEMWMILLLINCMIYLPLHAAFPLHHISPHFHSLDIAFSIATLCNVVIRYRTGYVDYKEKIVIMNQGVIIKKQVFSIYFLGDLIQAIPKIGDPSKNNVLWLLNVLSLLKLMRLKTVLQYMDNTAKHFRVKHLLYRVLKILITGTLIVHFIACIFFLIPRIRYRLNNSKYFHPDSWVESFLKGNDIEIIKPYLLCFYKASGSILGVDPGLHGTKVFEELYYEIFTYLLGKMLLCYLIVLVLEILQQFYQLEMKYYSMINEVHCYMKANNLPVRTREKIIQNYEYKYRRKYFQEYVITNFFTDRLKKDINYQILSRFVANTPLFEQLPKRTIENVLTQLKMEIYLPADEIIRAGTTGDCMYIISSGTVAVITKSGKEVCHLLDGDYFGEIALLGSHKKRISSVIAIEFCEIYKLSKKDFKKCFSQHPDLFKTIHLLAVERASFTEAIEQEYKDDIKKKKIKAEHHSFTTTSSVTISLV